MNASKVRILLTALFITINVCLAQTNEIKTGLITGYSVDTKLFPKAADYFKPPVPNKFYKAVKNNEVPKGWVTEEETPEASVSYKPGENTAVVYVPKNYDGRTPFGIYLHISPSPGGIKPSADWQALMDKLMLIYVSADKTQNNTPFWRRVVFSLDSMATVKKHYNIDSKRVFVGGLSGGGHIAMLTQMLYPEYFQGAISHAAQSYLPSGGSGGHFVGLTMTDILKDPRKTRKWAVIGGDKDSNYQAILKTTEDWKKTKMQYKFFFVPGMPHQNASAASLEEVLAWMGADKSLPKIAAPGGSTQAADQADIRTWTLKDGKTVEGTYVKNIGYYVLIKTVSNKTVQLTIQNLSDEDKEYLKGLKQSGTALKQ